MTNFTDYLFGIVAVVYGLAGLGLMIYTDRLQKRIKEQEEQRSAHLKHHLDHHDCPSHPDSDETAVPLLGVVWPPVVDKND